MLNNEKPSFMNKNGYMDNGIDVADVDVANALTPDVTSKIKTLTDLWALARMTRDLAGDDVWEALYQMGCNPEPVDNVGYDFDYKGLKGLYVPKKKSSGIIRFAIPKLANIGIKSREKLMESVNTANSLVPESKFTIMGDDVWLIHERIVSGNEDYSALVEHILENIKSAAELFYKIL